MCKEIGSCIIKFENTDITAYDCSVVSKCIEVSPTPPRISYSFFLVLVNFSLWVRDLHHFSNILLLLKMLSSCATLVPFYISEDVDKYYYYVSYSRCWTVSTEKSMVEMTLTLQSTFLTRHQE